MRFRLASVTALVAVPALLAGCSGPEAASPPPRSAPPPASAGASGPASGKVAPEDVAWVNRLCGLVGGFTEAQSKGPGVDKSSPEAFKATSAARLEAAAGEAETTLRGLRQMKPSPIPGAEGITATFEKGFVRVRDVLSSAKAKAEQVDTSDKRAFMQGMQAVKQELQKGRAIDFNAGFDKFTRNRQLNAAAAKAPECKAMMNTTPPPKQAPPPR